MSLVECGRIVKLSVKAQGERHGLVRFEILFPLDVVRGDRTVIEGVSGVTAVRIVLSIKSCLMFGGRHLIWKETLMFRCHPALHTC